MKHRVGLGLALVMCAAAEAAEPVSVAAAAPAETTPAAVATPAVVPPAALPTKRLDLRIGDIRRYMMPNELREAVTGPDAEANTVVVEGQRELLPVAYEKPIPVGPLMPVFWALMHPTNSWRILVPDLNRPPPGPPEVVPPPIFRWGP